MKVQSAQEDWALDLIGDLIFFSQFTILRKFFIQVEAI